MIKFLRNFIFFLFCLLSFDAFASAPVNTPTYNIGGITYFTMGEYCASAQTSFPKATRVVIENTGGWQCTFYNVNTYIGSSVIYITYKMVCPPMNTAPDLTKTLEKQCGDVTPPEPCKDKQPIIVKFAMKSGGNMPNHVGVCMIVVNEILICRKETVSGASTDICMLQVTRTGDLWTPTSNDPPNPGVEQSTPEDKNAPKIPIPPTTTGDKGGSCPAGSVQGGTDSSGIPVCIGTGSTPPATDKTPSVTTKPPVTVTNSDGSKTTTQTSTNTNADGSTTTTNTVTTVAADGTVTKTGDTTVSKTPSGAAGTKDDPEKSNFCKENPTLSICINSSVTGSCELTACTGDAIQCATTRAVRTLECRDKDDRDTLSKVPYLASGQSIVGGTDPMKGQIDAAVKGTEVDLGANRLDQTGFLGGGSCLPSRNLNMLGKSVSMDFGPFCNQIQPLRYVFLMIGFICAYLIVSKSVLKG